MPTKCKQPKQAIHADRNQKIQRPQTNANKTFSRQRFCVWRQTCFIMTPKTGSKKLVETWRPERDLDCMQLLLMYAVVTEIASSPRSAFSSRQVAQSLRKCRIAFGIWSMAAIQQPALLVFVEDHRQTSGGLAKGRLAAANRQKLLQRPLGLRALGAPGDG